MSTPSVLTTLEAKTNSDRDIPSHAVVNVIELDTLICWAKSVIDWETNKALLSLKISDLPDCSLINSDGSDWGGTQWEQTATDVNHHSCTLLWVNDDTGDELFFVYDQNA
ncbi:hypothetical protein [Vibrio harveyi]|uniref:hypothetical protein n=1 Tax=Vibrio harveyi TaxID=669 RepID=UPI003BB54613|nr:hypothetical protein [Vibrio harveyi]